MKNKEQSNRRSPARLTGDKKEMFAGAKKLLFERAAALRKQPTFAEDILWNYLRTKPFGLKFRRQHAFSNYILGFYCHALQVVIEVDGSIHQLEDVKANDMQREKQLKELGLTVMRFTTDDIRIAQEQVIRQIEAFLEKKIEARNDANT